MPDAALSQSASAVRARPAPLRILGRANSFNVRKVLWLCDELGIPYQREDWGRGHRPTNTPEFLALNPTGQVPVVLDGEWHHPACDSEGPSGEYGELEQRNEQVPARLGGNEGVVLGAQIQLVVEAGSPVVAGATVGGQRMLLLERLDVLHGHVQLVGDPRVGPALPDPAADLIELCFQ